MSPPFFLCCDKAVSAAANELSRQWAVRISTAHRLEIRRALHLLPSDNKDLGYANKKIPNLVIEDSGLRYVGMTGFEPATTRPPDAYSNRAELHPEVIFVETKIITFSQLLPINHKKI